MAPNSASGVLGPANSISRFPGIAGHPDDGTGAVAVIDPKTKKVVNTFLIPVDDCAAPQGMAVGPDSQILLGCNAAVSQWALEHRYHQRTYAGRSLEGSRTLGVTTKSGSIQATATTSSPAASSRCPRSNSGSSTLPVTDRIKS